TGPPMLSWDGELRQCKEWTGYTQPKGYGQVRYRGRGWVVHDLVWTWSQGPIPSGKILMHSCDNPACCEVSHLKVGTRAENNQDCKQKGRNNRGGRHGMAKLTDADELTDADVLDI